MSMSTNDLTQPHPCVIDGCTAVVPYDDEPWCFVHSPDSGSSVRGYSYRANNPTQEVTVMIRPELHDGHMLRVPGTSSCIYVHVNQIWFAPDLVTHAKPFSLSDPDGFRTMLRNHYQGWPRRVREGVDQLVDYVWTVTS